MIIIKDTRGGKNMKPVISKSAHIAKESILIGDVHVGNEATVLYYAVLRGDNGRTVCCTLTLDIRF